MSNSLTSANARRALLFFLSPQDNYRKPLFSANEVFCGPDAETRISAGHVSALKAPLGTYDVGEILNRLPGEQQPEILIVKADSTRRNFPRNLSRVACPKVLIVGVTHFLHHPIRTLIEYAKAEPFDFVIMEVTRHHARWFAEAGVQNLHWLPAVSFNCMPRPLNPKPSRPLTFVGQAGKHHPYRVKVLEELQAADLPLQILQGKPQQTADVYADSQVTLNVSLNGDLNMRVFEVLSAGGCLLTDELGHDSGLRQVFEPGRHLDTWRTPGELVEKVRHYLARPAECRRLREAGQAELMRQHSPAVKLREFYDLIDSGRVNPRYALQGESWYRSAATIPVGDLMSRIAAHEAIQELHRSAHEVVMIGVPAGRQDELAGLPRVRFAPISEARSPAKSAAGVVVHRVLACTETLEDDALLRFDGQYFLPLTDDQILRERLATWGISPADADSPLLRVTQPVLWIQQAWARGERDLVRARLRDAFRSVKSAADCLVVANYAEELSELVLQMEALEMAIALDRNCGDALLRMAASTLDQSDASSTFALLEEASRAGLLPEEAVQLHSELAGEAQNDPRLRDYLTTIGRLSREAPVSPLSVVLITNLLPPQELGGYGRMMWEFAHGLIARGHTVRVLTSDVTDFGKTPTADEVEMERHVSRTLKLLGTWEGGRASAVREPREVERRTRDNIARIEKAIAKEKTDFVIVGNLDLMGRALLEPALQRNIPTLHALANALPGYAVKAQPAEPHYWVAPCSDWNGEVFKQAGYAPARVETLYPGARVDRFFRLFLPDTQRLRICYASLVLPYKGADTLVHALARLHEAGIDFTAEIAGDAPDGAFLAELRELARSRGLAERVRFTGFLDRNGLSALFARSNVLVFPSRFQEPFGISQVEALAAGLVVVSSGTGGAKEIIRDNTDGLLFAAGDDVDLARKLTALAKTPGLMSRLQRAGQVRARTFSVENAVLKIERLAAEMIAKAAGGAQAAAA